MFSVKIALDSCRTPSHLFVGLYELDLFLGRMIMGKLEL